MDIDQLIGKFYNRLKKADIVYIEGVRKRKKGKDI